jgi:hypothetical protein
MRCDEEEWALETHAPPSLPGFVMLETPNVMVGGFPVPSSQEIAKWLKNKLKALKAKRGKGPAKKGDTKGGGVNCAP